MSLTIAESACRVCLREQEIMISLFDIVEDFQKQRLSDLLEQCTSLKVDRSDNQPKLICDECTGELLVVAKFHKKCLRTLEILSHVQTNVVDEEDDKHVEIEPDRIQVEEADAAITEEDDAGEVLAAEDYDMDGIIVEKEMTEEEDADVENSSPTQMKEEILYEAVCYGDEEQIILFEPEDTEDEIRTNDESKTDTDENGIECAKMKSFSKLQDKSAAIIKLRPLIINCKCDVCGAGFTHFNNLSRHLQTHNPAEIYTCGICQCPFTTFLALQNHSEEHQKDVESLEKDFIEEDSESKDDAGALVDSVVTVANEENRRLKYCDICNKPFISKSALEAHIRTHTGDRPFKCKLCPKAFKTQGGLALHLRRHSGLRPYTCNVCKKGFGESSNLRVHMRTHTGEKPHKCTICNRSFTRVFLLQIHLRTHTGERPYQCPYCDKAFAQGGDLASHKRTHTGERPHVCSVCKKGFIKSSGLTQHLRKHANHVYHKLLDVTEMMDVIVDDDENPAETSEDNDYVIEFPPDIET